MKNWLIILIIFIAPLTLYGFLDAQSSCSDKAMAKNEALQKIASGPLTLYKFYSPLCKDCQKQSKELTSIKEEYSNKVTFKDINVSGAPGNSQEVQDLIKRYDINVVPTVVIIDSKGKKLKKYDSVVKYDELKSVLDGLIEEK